MSSGLYLVCGACRLRWHHCDLPRPISELAAELEGITCPACTSNDVRIGPSRPKPQQEPQ